MTRAAVVGLGSPLRGDDGVGPEVVRRLAEGGLPEDVDALDAGTGGVGLLDLLGRYDRAVVVDCARMGLPPGSVRSFRPDEARSRSGAERIGMHDVDPLAVIALGRELGMRLEVTLVGVEPERMEHEVGLSESVLAAVPEAMRAALHALEIRRRDGENHG
jgi:hydrogenase maturation protease